MENARFDHLVRFITAGHTSRRAVVTGCAPSPWRGVLQPAPGSRWAPGAATGTSDARRARAHRNRAVVLQWRFVRWHRRKALRRP